MKYIAYCRVSTDYQVKNGCSLESQKSICEDYARKKGMCLHKSFNDAGLSGTLPIHRRPGLKAAIDEIEKGDVLLVAYRDRLARDPEVTCDINREIRRRKARVVSCAGEGTESDDEYDLAAAIAYYASDFLSKMEQVLAKVRCKKKTEEKRSKGERCGYIPFGQKLSEDGVHVEPNEDEKKIIEEMQKLEYDGYSLAKIATILNKNKMHNRDNKKWNYASVYRILLHNRVVA